VPSLRSIKMSRYWFAVLWKYWWIIAALIVMLWVFTQLR
jgi:hypothetical protein